MSNSQYSPAAIEAGFTAAAKGDPSLGLQLSGIEGNAQHVAEGGYHVARALCRADDYSVQLAIDKLGDEWAASALDSTPKNLAAQETLTRRLMDACQNNHPDTYAIREFFGTEDGKTVTGWDRHDPSKLQDDGYTTSDDSHLWHVHISGYRKYANDPEAWAAIARVMAGTTTAPPVNNPSEDDMFIYTITIDGKGKPIAKAKQVKVGWAPGYYREFLPTDKIATNAAGLLARGAKDCGAINAAQAGFLKAVSASEV